MRGVDDGDALEASQGEQILIAGDDEVGACGQRAFEHTVVVGIA